MPRVPFFFPFMLADYVNNEFPLPVDSDNFKPQEYPHWAVFINLCLGQPFTGEELTSNAKVIGKLTMKEVMTVTCEDLETKGFILANEIPSYWD